MSFKIEKNIPVPRKRDAHLFDEMEVGDSFFVPCESGANKKSVRSNLQGFARIWTIKNKKDYKFQTSSCESGVLIWRVK